MDKQMIEEMARDMCGISYTSVTGDCVCGVLKFECNCKCNHFERAKRLYNAGYRKIPENAVVLTKEEYEKEVRKETAEKFAERLKEELTEIIPFEDYEIADWNYDGMDIENAIDEICKEITENKNDGK